MTDAGVVFLIAGGLVAAMLIHDLRPFRKLDMWIGRMARRMRKW